MWKALFIFDTYGSGVKSIRGTRALPLLAQECRSLLMRRLRQRGGQACYRRGRMLSNREDAKNYNLGYETQRFNRTGGRLGICSERSRDYTLGDLLVSARHGAVRRTGKNGEALMVRITFKRQEIRKFYG